MKRYEKSSLHGLVEKYSMVLALHKHWINNINEFGVCIRYITVNSVRQELERNFALQNRMKIAFSVSPPTVLIKAVIL